MSNSRVHKTYQIDAPQEFVFQRLVDHQAMSRWPGVSSCRLIREGTPPNGVGAVREVKTGGLTLIEEVVLFEPPHRYDYEVTRGLPVEHHGTVTLTPAGSGVRLDWVVELSSRAPLVAGVVGKVLDLGLGRALAFFVERTESRSQG